MCFLARWIALARPLVSPKSDCWMSPFRITLQLLPTRVKNIFISCGVTFWASSRITKASWKLRPLIVSKGAISMLPFLIPVSTAPLPKCQCNTSNTGITQGIIFSSSVPGKYPILLPAATLGLVMMILSIA